MYELKAFPHPVFRGLGRRTNGFLLPDSEDIFGKSGISGKGSLDFEAESGEYTVYFNQHAAVGTAKVTAKANK